MKTAKSARDEVENEITNLVAQTIFDDNKKAGKKAYNYADRLLDTTLELIECELQEKETRQLISQAMRGEI